MIKQVPTYAKFLKNLCIIKRGLNVNKKVMDFLWWNGICPLKLPLMDFLFKVTKISHNQVMRAEVISLRNPK